MRIRYIVPLPYTNQEAVANRAVQIPRDVLGEDTEVVCVPLRNDIIIVDSYYGDLILDMYVTEAGLRAEEEGFDAVVIDTVSDSGMLPLRSRLSIPVIGPGLVSYVMGVLLGRRFSILTMWKEWVHLYEKNLDTYDLWGRCASIRTADIPPDVESLLEGKEEEVFPRLEEEALRAIEEDGADVILLGSTTMHQAGEYLASRLPVPVVNPGPIAIKMAQELVRMGLSHSKVAYPSPAISQDDKFFSVLAAEAPDSSREE